MRFADARLKNTVPEVTAGKFDQGEINLVRVSKEFELSE
jgi:hypothetical protein